MENSFAHNKHYQVSQENGNVTFQLLSIPVALLKVAPFAYLATGIGGFCASFVIMVYLFAFLFGHASMFSVLLALVGAGVGAFAAVYFLAMKVFARKEVLKLVANEGVVLNDGRTIPFADITDVNFITVGVDSSGKVARKGANTYVVVRTKGNNVAVTGGVQYNDAQEIAGTILNYKKNTVTLETQNFVS